MPYPAVAALPPAPSKISDQVNFVNQSALYLQALPTFRTEYNALIAYINAAFPNRFNCGVIGEINPTKPTVTVVANPTGSGVTYVSAIDVLYNGLQLNSANASAVGLYIDNVIALTGSVTSDASNPVIPLLPVPHSRTQSLAAFNTSASAFSLTAANATSALNSCYTYIDQTCLQNEDMGLITDTNITETIDNGLITDSVITN